jgi:hypothetical protein
MICGADRFCISHPVDVPSYGYTSPAEFAQIPAIVAAANALRNVQVANKVRLADLPPLSRLLMTAEPVAGGVTST